MNQSQRKTAARHERRAAAVVTLTEQTGVIMVRGYQGAMQFHLVHPSGQGLVCGAQDVWVERCRPDVVAIPERVCYYCANEANVTLDEIADEFNTTWKAVLS